LVIPPAFTLTASLLISIDESSTLTDKVPGVAAELADASVPVVKLRPFPALNAVALLFHFSESAI
jgi:hypothetical protein